MIDFQCNKEDCVNSGIKYQSLGNSSWAECGGCKSILTGTNERPDPVIEEHSSGMPPLP
jgi:hypothetical protein